MADIITTFKYNFTGNAAIAAEAALPEPGQFRRVVSATLHLSADPGVTDFTVTLDSREGAIYDTLIGTQAMSGITNLLW